MHTFLPITERRAKAVVMQPQSPRPVNYQPIKCLTLTGKLFVLALLFFNAESLVAQPVQKWAAKLAQGSYANWDLGNKVSTDAAGNVFVTGHALNPATGNEDYITAKYNAVTGAQEWIAYYNGTGNNNDQAISIAVDASGNAYVTGRSYGGSSQNDFATIKYNGSTGTQEWVSRYNGTGNGNDQAISVAVDASGNAYVTGNSLGISSQNDYTTIKYNGSTGTQEWASHYNGTGNSLDYAVSIAVDASGDAYVTGYSWVAGSQYDYATVKYNGSNGTQVWASGYNGTGNSLDYAISVAVDASGDAYVSGYGWGADSQYDYATVKYNGSTGTQVWASRYNGTGNGYDFAFSLAVDASGNAYVTGRSYGGSSQYDYATVKYNSSTGAEEWATRYNGTGNGYDYAYSIAVDDAGDAYVSGRSYGSSSNEDCATVKYNSTTGRQEWVTRYDGIGASSLRQSGLGIALDAFGGINVVGTDYESPWGIGIVKYELQTILPLEISDLSSPKTNGFNIACHGAGTGEATVTTTGGQAPYTYEWSNGQSVATVTGLTDLTHTATGLVAGLYTVTVTDANNTSTQQSITLTQPTALTVSGLLTPDVAHTGAQQNTVYLGYGPQSRTLTAVATLGVGPYSYVWTPAAGLSATTGTVVTASPVVSTVYTVTATDANGCTAALTHAIQVIDAGCSNNINNYKVLMCHEGQTICVSENAALTHLAHGCTVGACGPARVMAEPEVAQPTLLAYPNPNNGNFTLEVDASAAGQVMLDLVDVTGRSISQLFGGSLEAGQKQVIEVKKAGLPDGIYLVRMQSQGKLTILRIAIHP